MGGEWKAGLVFTVIGLEFLVGLGLLIFFVKKSSVHVQERQAWFVLSLIVLAVVTGMSLVAMFGFPKHWEALFGTFGVFGWSGLMSIIGYREKRAGRIVMDERDLEIGRCASLAGFSIFWGVFVLACMIPFFVKGPQGTLTLRTTTLADAVWIAWIIVFTMRSLVTVILYRRAAHGEETA